MRYEIYILWDNVKISNKLIFLTMQIIENNNEWFKTNVVQLISLQI